MSEVSQIEGKRRWGVPLYGQVLGWFFVNLAVVGVVMWLALRWQFGMGMGELFENRVAERLEERADLVARELRASRREDWEAILRFYGETMDLEFAVQMRGGAEQHGAEVPDGFRRDAREKMMEVSGRRESPPVEFLEDLEGELGGEFGLGGPRRGPGGRGGDFEGERGPRPVGLGPGERMRPGDRRRGEPAVPEQGQFVVMREDETGKRWAAVQVFLGNEEYLHPPRGLMFVGAGPGEGREVFLDARPLILIGGGLLVLSGLMWLPFVHRVTRRLKVMTEGTERISEGDFGVKLASRRGDELGRLSRAIQRMAQRLGVLVDGQKRFLGDTAHELCSPLARMRMGLGVLEQRLEGADRERLKAVEEEVGELARLVDELLEFSKASLSKRQLSLEEVKLVAMCEEVCGKESQGCGWAVRGGVGRR
ncbi:MAG: HAMP domain-containing sensor histidine kinase, partial [Verrucomicrobiota bacterium]